MKNRFKKLTSFITTLCIILCSVSIMPVQASENPTIYLIGDSLVTRWDSRYDAIQGWGCYFADFFNGTVKVSNKAISGMTANQYYNLSEYKSSECFQRFKGNIKEGDYVFISFGTNDEKRSGYKSDSYKYIDENRNEVEEQIGLRVEKYGEYLQKYVNDIKAKGAVCVFVTVPTQADKVDKCAAYNEKMRAIASKNNVLCIDLNLIQKEYINYVKKLSKNSADQSAAVPQSVVNEMFVTSVGKWTNIRGEETDYTTDNVHYKAEGAQKLAKWIANDIYSSDDARMKTLAGYMDASRFAPSKNADNVMENITVTKNSGNYTLEGTLTSAILDKAVVFAAVYDASENLRQATVKDVAFVGSTAEITNETISCTPQDDDIVRLFVWDRATLTPQMMSVTKDITVNSSVTAVEMANGVRLSWDAFGGAKTYDLYENGVKVASNIGTPVGNGKYSYDYKYFSTLTALVADTTNAYTTDRTYYVKAGNKISAVSNSASADTSLIHYISFDGVKDKVKSDADLTNYGASGKGIKMSSDIVWNKIVDLKTPNCWRYHTSDTSYTEYKSRYRYVSTTNGLLDESGLHLVMGAFKRHDDGKGDPIIGDGTKADPYINKDSADASKYNNNTKPCSVQTSAVIKPFGKGDTSAREYTVIMDANIKTAGQDLELLALKKEPDKKLDKSRNYLRKASPVYVYDGQGKQLGSFKSATDHRWNIPASESSYIGKYYTYVFNIGACINGTDVNVKFYGPLANQGGDESAAIKNFGIIPKDKFIK